MRYTALGEDAHVVVQQVVRKYDRNAYPDADADALPNATNAHRCADQGKHDTA